MSLESSQKSDIYEKMLAEDNPLPFLAELSPRRGAEEEGGFNPFKSMIKFAP
jgi:hypothetical protein